VMDGVYINGLKIASTKFPLHHFRPVFMDLSSMGICFANSKLEQTVSEVIANKQMTWASRDYGLTMEFHFKKRENTSVI